MLRTFGAVLIGCSAAYMGITLSLQMRRQLQAVTALRDSLLNMQQKISFYRLPLPALMRELALEQADTLSVFYARAAAELEKNRRFTAEAVLLRCLEEEGNLGLPEAGRQCCVRLFRCLGRMDGQHQAEALQRIIEELDELEGRLREDLHRQSRCYCAIGVCSGLAVTILLV